MSHMGLTLLQIIHHYGSVGVFFLLAVGVLALPVPDETLLLLTGALAKNQTLSVFPAGVAACLGAITGITLSYVLGQAIGRFALQRLCQKFRINTKHLDKAEASFAKIGQWFLLIGFFVPGVRHFIGIIAGAARLHYLRFIIFGWVGAILWTNIFFWLGYYYGIKALHAVLAM